MVVLPSELQLATSCVIQAGRLASDAEAVGGLISLTREDGLEVTEIDFAIQALMGSCLEAKAPNDQFVSEETTRLLDTIPTLSDRTLALVKTVLPQSTENTMRAWIERGAGEPTGDRFWLLDPIDSPWSLVKGAAYSVQLSGIWDGQVQVAVTAHPKALGSWTPQNMLISSGLIFLAARGQGAWWAPMDDPSDLHPLHVSSRPLEDAIRLQANPPNELDADRLLREAVTRELGFPASIRCASPRRYALIASGEADLLIHLNLIRRRVMKAYSWRHAAGSLLVEEAGGRVSDLDGRPLDFTAGRVLSRNRGLVVSNGLIHDDALTAIQRAEAKP